MELTLKNGLIVSEREIRFYHKFSERAITKQMAKCERELPYYYSQKAIPILTIVAMRQELELRKHPDYD